MVVRLQSDVVPEILEMIGLKSWTLHKEHVQFVSAVVSNIMMVFHLGGPRMWPYQGMAGFQFVEAQPLVACDGTQKLVTG